jgi:hypothetical protein
MWKDEENKIKMQQKTAVSIWMENEIIKYGDRTSIIQEV